MFCLLLLVSNLQIYKKFIKIYKKKTYLTNNKLVRAETTIEFFEKLLYLGELVMSQGARISLQNQLCGNNQECP